MAQRVDALEPAYSQDLRALDRAVAGDLAAPVVGPVVDHVRLAGPVADAGAAHSAKLPSWIWIHLGASSSKARQRA